MKEPIRILHVIGKMDRGGAETMIMNFYRKLDREKFQFDFLVFHEERGDYDDEIEKLGGRIYRLPVFLIYNYVSFRKHIKQFFKENYWPIVHGHIRSSAAIYLSEAKKHRSYTIAHCHSTDSSNWLIRMMFHVLTYRIRYVADYFLACSTEAGIAGFGKNVVSSDCFDVLFNAIDCGLYQYTEKRHADLKKKYNLQNKYVIGHVGRFATAKNHDFLINIFQKLEQMDDDTVLILVGKGSLEEKIRKKVAQNHLQDKVIFMGLRKDIPDIMNLFDLFLFPSLYEGLGIVGIEAQAAGLPCIFSDTIPMNAIVTDNVTRISLNAPIVEWVNTIQKYKKTFCRRDQSDCVKKSRYDIITETRKLEQLYSKGIGD
jgi:glycosyltransferase involved in cell wall biosynthesis